MRVASDGLFIKGKLGKSESLAAWRSFNEHDRRGEGWFIRMKAWWDTYGHGGGCFLRYINRRLVGVWPYAACNVCHDDCLRFPWVTV